MTVNQSSETDENSGRNDTSAPDRLRQEEPETEREFSIPGPVLSATLLSKLVTALDARPADFSTGDASLLKRAAETLADNPPNGSEALQVILGIARRQESMQLSVAGTPLRGYALPADREVQVSIEVPADVEGGEALLLERRSNGAITVLSTHGLMHGDIVAEKRFIVPRPLSDLTGTLLLDGPGSVDLIAVFVRDRGISLRRHPLFRKTELDTEDYGRPVDLKPAKEYDLCVLLRQILGIPASHWAVAHTCMSVLGTISPQASHDETTRGTEDIHPQSVRRNRVQQEQAETTTMTDDFLELMKLHADEVHALAGNNERYRSHETLMQRGEFDDRWLYCDDLFLGTKETGNDRLNLIRACAQTARPAFGLVYDDQKKTWKPSGTSGNTSSDGVSSRTKGFLDRIINGDPTLTSFPKVDMALIALSHGLPLRLWEARNRNAFKHFANLERERRRGANSEIPPMLAFSSLDYLLADIQDTPNLQVYDDKQQAAEAGIRSARTELGLPPLSSEVERGLRMARVSSKAHVRVKKVRPGADLWFQFDIPESLERAEALLFEISEQQAEDSGPNKTVVSLLSTAVAHASRIEFKNKFESPTASNINYTLDHANKTSLVLLIAKPKSSTSQLSNLAFFKRTKNIEASIELTATDLDDLRDCIMSMEPEDRAILRRQVIVEGQTLPTQNP